MCNTSSDAAIELAQCGMLHHLAEMLNKAFSSMAFLTPSSGSGYLYGQLVKFIMSMIHHFACGSSLYMCNIIQSYVLDTVLSAVDLNSPSLYVSGTMKTKILLESLTVGHSLVGQLMQSSHICTKTVYHRLLGCDIAAITGTALLLGDSFVVDLYDTSRDTDDVHIVEKLQSPGSASSDWKSVSSSLDCVEEWVDVYVTCVLDGAHFVAVFGPENLERFHHLRESVKTVVADHSTLLKDLPSPGDLVYVTHPTLGSFRAYVVKVSNNSDIVTFAPDCGYIEEVPLSCLRMLEDCTIPLPESPLIHVCEIFG